jgi:hypothetical protein
VQVTREVANLTRCAFDPGSFPHVMIIDLTTIGELDDKERKHLELSVYVGYALERAQKFEQAVALLIALSRADDRLDDNEAFRADLDRLMSKRMVDLLHRCVEQALITQEVADHCERARKRRNKFVHGFFREYDLHTKLGLFAAWADVQASHSLFDAVHGLLAEAVAAAITSLGFTEEEVEQSQALVRELQEKDWT